MAPIKEEMFVAGVITTSLALHLSMLIVGAQYNSEKYCKLEASQYIYSKVSIIRPGCSRHLEFEKKIVLVVY